MTKITIKIDTEDSETKVTTTTVNPKIDVPKVEPPNDLKSFKAFLLEGISKPHTHPCYLNQGLDSI